MQKNLAPPFLFFLSLAAALLTLFALPNALASSLSGFAIAADQGQLQQSQDGQGGGAAEGKQKNIFEAIQTAFAQFSTAASEAALSIASGAVGLITAPLNAMTEFIPAKVRQAAQAISSAAGTVQGMVERAKDAIAPRAAENGLGIGGAPSSQGGSGASGGRFGRAGPGGNAQTPGGPNGDAMSGVQDGISAEGGRGEQNIGDDTGLRKAASNPRQENSGEASQKLVEKNLKKPFEGFQKFPPLEAAAKTGDDVQGQKRDVTAGNPPNYASSVAGAMQAESRGAENPVIPLQPPKPPALAQPDFSSLLEPAVHAIGGIISQITLFFGGKDEADFATARKNLPSAQVISQSGDLMQTSLPSLMRAKPG